MLWTSLGPRGWGINTGLLVSLFSDHKPSCSLFTWGWNAIKPSQVQSMSSIRKISHNLNISFTRWRVKAEHATQESRLPECDRSRSADHSSCAEGPAFWGSYFWLVWAWFKRAKCPLAERLGALLEHLFRLSFILKKSTLCTPRTTVQWMRDYLKSLPLTWIKTSG